MPWGIDAQELSDTPVYWRLSVSVSSSTLEAKSCETYDNNTSTVKVRLIILKWVNNHCFIGEKEIVICKRMSWENPVGGTVFVSQIVDCVQLGEATALPVTVRLNKATQHPQHPYKCL